MCLTLVCISDFEKRRSVKVWMARSSPGTDRVQDFQPGCTISHPLDRRLQSLAVDKSARSSQAVCTALKAEVELGVLIEMPLDVDSPLSARQREGAPEVSRTDRPTP